jgi:hypothetical protein
MKSSVNLMYKLIRFMSEMKQSKCGILSGINTKWFRRILLENRFLYLKMFRLLSNSFSPVWLAKSV